MKDKQKNTQINDSSSTVQVSDEQQIYTKENSPAIDQEDQDIKQNKKDIKTLYTIGFWFLFIIVLIGCIYFGKSILLPVMVSTFIALLCSPLVNYLEKIGIPRTVGVLSVIFLIVGLLFGGVAVLTEPAQQWWSKLPELVKDISQEVTNATNNAGTSSALNEAIVSSSNVGEFRSTTVVSLVKSIAVATPTAITQLMISLFMAYFMLSYGRSLFTGFLMQFDHLSNKRKTVELVRVIQKDLSRYIGTVTLINIALGIVVGCVFFIFGVEDPFLWGTLAGIMNFAPYLGPLISMICFGVITYVQFDSMSYAFIIIATYLVINMAESQFVTPTLLGRRFNLNPLIIFMWLILWGWLWGSMGMLLGVPLLVCLNTLLERLDIFGRSHLVLRAR
ncbi:AI-2E family transporter [Psychromonas sp. L1A2]|uniref:AI-2E family transporter n=1 Tax=Psychromonas sp. L1A2 TaxID=2686356 RepID=UPI00191585AC|nr:AI-2E family transporter [Psychromonas sp. L1A2]